VSSEIEIVVAGEQLVLLGEGGLYWPARATLFIADPHFGKAASFRANGIPVPGGTTGGNIARLESALSQTGAQRLICLGDLLHARSGRSEQTLAAVTAWREQRPALEWLLVRGNHDRHAGDPPEAWQVRCIDAPLLEAPFVLQHEPAEASEGYALAGHVHPAARVGRGKLAEQLPCFLFGQRQALLPAFGEFTGMALVRPQPGDRVFVLAGGEVFRLG
jgi:uncharacterized protein